MLNQKEDENSTADQLDIQLRTTNVVKLGVKRGCVGTLSALKLLLGVEATPLDLRHKPTELDTLRKLADYRMMPKRKMKNIWSWNRERELKSYVMVPA